MKSSRTRRRRLGTILVLTAVMMVAMFALLAVAVDIGYVTLIRTQLQSAADAAALAATQELYDNHTLPPTTIAEARAAALESARDYARLNLVGGTGPELADTDVVFLPSAATGSLNATYVRVRRAADINGEIPTFFMRVLGVDSSSGGAEAKAMFDDNFFSGFEPSEKGNLMILPFALDKQTWEQTLERLLAGNGDDDWTWDEENQEITPGSDGIPEANLFPQGTGSPGNRGTVDIGARNNSAADAARQIVEGVNAADLEHIGGKLELGPDGTLELNGDTGISAGMKNALASIRGKPRIIPLFSSVSGNGNNATYTIVGFAGVRVMDVKLTGQMSGKRVIIQPARVQVYGGIPASDDSRTSDFIYSHSPVRLVH
ncbi:MAG: pilus assembly protein TadG-related protein [Planctomycetales bacterium]|nr:pilus assembly protein TadG-related protein [Planctomycetales bacterium]